MAWTARTRATIRDAFLADIETRFALAGVPIDTGEGSYHFRLAESLALILESQEVQAKNNTNDILVDQASEAAVVRHGDVEGVPREEATKAILQVTISGTALATVTFGSSRLVSTAGLSYTVTANADGTGASVVLSGGGTGTAYAKCQTAGIDGNLADGTTLTWSTTPTNANPTATVAATNTLAQDQETKDVWAQRILAIRKERPAGENRSQIREWAQAVLGVYEAYAYPLWHQPLYGTNTRGAVTVVIVGPPQGTSASKTRILSANVADRVSDYIEGLVDENGVAVTNGTQLRSTTVESGAYTIIEGVDNEQNVTLALTMASDAPFPWTSATAYVVTAWNGTTKVITTSADPVLAEEGDTIGLRDDSRGKYTYGKVTGVNHGTNEITMESTFSPGSVDTTATGRVRPAPPTVTSIRDGIFEYFDTLSPGDTSPASRWPIIDSERPAVMYKQAVAAAAISNAGGSVLSASVTTPASDVTPAVREIISLGELILT